MITDPETQILAPICFSCDETHLNGAKRTGCCPLLFSTTLFGQKLRNLPNAWRPLGYIYDMGIHSSTSERERMNTTTKTQRLQSIFRAVLDSFILCQRAGGLHGISLTLGGITKTVDIKIPCAFIIGDIQGGDKLCGRKLTYQDSAKRLCRKCNISGAEAGDPDAVCRNISMHRVISYVAENRQHVLDRFTQHNVHCAWFDVDYGGCRFGIFSAACPIEPLHSLENGLMADCLRILFQEMGTAACATLDRLVKDMLLWGRQRSFSSGSDPDMPRLLWKDGITNLSELTATHKVGIMLTVVVVALTEAGRAHLLASLGSPRRYNELLYVFQMLLCYWAWLKQEVYWSLGDRVEKRKAGKQSDSC